MAKCALFSTRNSARVMLGVSSGSITSKMVVNTSAATSLGPSFATTLLDASNVISVPLRATPKDSAENFTRDWAARKRHGQRYRSEDLGRRIGRSQNPCGRMCRRIPYRDRPAETEPRAGGLGRDRRPRSEVFEIQHGRSTHRGALDEQCRERHREHAPCRFPTLFMLPEILNMLHAPFHRGSAPSAIFTVTVTDDVLVTVNVTRPPADVFAMGPIRLDAFRCCKGLLSPPMRHSATG